MRIKDYELPDWVVSTTYGCNYTPDRDTYLQYQGWQIESHTKFSQSHFFMMISPISSHLSLPHPQLYHHLNTRS
jgi:hypothetical protein